MRESGLGAPIAADQVTAGVGAVALQVEPGNMQQPLAAVVTATGRLAAASWDGLYGWSWTDLGTPAPGVLARRGMGLVTVQPAADGARVPYAFVSAGLNSSLHYVWWNMSGSSWSDLGTPGPGRQIKNSVGATTVQDNSKAQQRPHVYVLAGGPVPDAASVCLAWWDGANWQWSDLGLPAPAVAIVSGAGALSVQSGPGSPQYPRAFVLGGNGHLYMHAIGGASPGWTDHGAPGGGTGVLGPVGTVAVRASSRAASVVYAFVLSVEGQVCVRWGNDADAGAGWVWQYLGSPDVPIVCGLGAVALEDAGSAEQQPCGYVLGADGAVYGVKLAGGLPCWQKEGTANRDAAGKAVGPVGAVAVHYPPLFTPAFPFIFARGNSGALLCDALDDPGWAWSDPGFPGAAP